MLSEFGKKAESRWNFFTLLSGAFLIQSGAHFFTLALCAFIYVNTSSPVQASLVFLSGTLPATFLSGRIGSWIDRNMSKRSFFLTLVTGLIILYITAFAVKAGLSVLVICLLLSLRSLVNFSSRTMISRWLKDISPAGEQGKRIKLYFLTFFLSTVMSGVLAGYTLSALSIVGLASLELALTLTGSLFFAFLILNKKRVDDYRKDRASEKAVSLRESVRQIMASEKLRECFLFVIVSQAFFQGAYSTLVSVLPIRIFEMGKDGIGFFQIAASGGIISGFLVCWVFPRIFNRSPGSLPLKPVFAGLAGATGLLLLGNVHSRDAAWALFLGVNFVYEVIWLFHTSEFFSHSPAADAGRLQFVLSTVASSAMGITALIYAFLIEMTTFSIGTLSYTTLCLSVAGLCALSSRRQELNKINSGVLSENDIS